MTSSSSIVREWWPASVGGSGLNISEVSLLVAQVPDLMGAEAKLVFHNYEHMYTALLCM